MRTLEAAALMGVEAIELSPRWVNLFQMTGSDIDALRLDIEQAGLQVSGINMDRTLFVRERNANSNLENLTAAILIAERLSAPVVSFALSAELDGLESRPIFTAADFTPAEIRYSAEQVRTLARKARARSVQVAVELHDDGMLDDPEACIAFLEQVGEPNVRLNPDIGNLCRNPDRPGDWRDAIHKLAPFANCWHVKNYRNARPAPLSSGDVDFGYATEVMLKAGFGGWISSESRAGEPWETQKRDLSYMAQVWKCAQ